MAKVIEILLTWPNIVTIAKPKLVPVIAVLTKYEALVDRVKGEYTERQVTKRDTLNYAKKNVFDPLKNVTHKPAAIVQTHRKSLMGIIITITIITLRPFRQRKRL